MATRSLFIHFGLLSHRLASWYFFFFVTLFCSGCRNAIAWPVIMGFDFSVFFWSLGCGSSDQWIASVLPYSIPTPFGR
ncbi:uncharacterized protein BDW43DRAFT_261784 [Aspergillus alliaceus]|uniref:uncharacterized protein n=1 Tax=Petromyces alliaceus TaxID=209559 RepID=UPI0012A6A935|nr:uncharacterized protein BDW43DRAFT_261784 [Aspergillus alliaceus]KAB8238486.1 hypothetical protein BDW43DRAFT_261784 [Aspergillus alliaceus]